jgi:hypothetical protein
LLLDARDEVLRADAVSGDLETVLVIERMKEGGFDWGRFVEKPAPIFVFELGIAVFRPDDGRVLWSRNDFMLDNFFQRVEGERILYSSEHLGDMEYDLSTGRQIVG